ncbi:MAG: malectin domain-containing carbohydrate-binding protein [Verrucomicrobiota bacterium]
MITKINFFTQGAFGLLSLLYFATTSLSANKSVAYIYGDVAADGTIPSGSAEPYDQMLLDDTSSEGLSMFKTLVEDQGYSIDQYYDATLTFDQSFLNQYNVIIFGLHQRVWTQAEQQLLDNWIRNGGGILMYSDSAAGGRFNLVGVDNPTGQNAVNSILSNYGMEVTVDQGQGTRSYQASTSTTNPIVFGGLVFEGEGISPIAVDPNGIAEVLIPLDPANLVNGGNLSINDSGITIQDPEWAVIAEAKVGLGYVLAIFDRQPIWNSGVGSNIQEEDNEEILRRIVRYLARDYGNSAEWVDLQLLSDNPADFLVSYRQWIDGSGSDGFNYVARNNMFALQQREDLITGDWRTESSLVQAVSSSPFGDGESETVTVQLVPDAEADTWFARVLVEGASVPPVAGSDQWIQLGGSARLEATVGDVDSQTWSKESGPGTVTFADASQTLTTATFSAAGIYVLKITTTTGGLSAEDSLTVNVVSSNDVEIAINCGGATYDGQNGFSYIADIYFEGGGIDAFPGNAVAGTDDDLLYNYARSANNTFTGYSIPVTNGNYLVILQFAETFFTEDNKRVFDVSIEGNLVLDDLDIHSSAPGKWVAFDQVFTTSVSDEVLDIGVAASINNPLLNGIVVIEQP